MMLAGNVITCVIVVTFVLEPSLATCIILTAGFHLSFTLTYAPLLVKTNRIYRIFHWGCRAAAKPPFVSSRAQVVIAVCIISVQVRRAHCHLLVNIGQRYFFSSSTVLSCVSVQLLRL